jgi:hypothetical protein
MNKNGFFSFTPVMLGSAVFADNLRAGVGNFTVEENIKQMKRFMSHDGTREITAKDWADHGFPGGEDEARRVGNEMLKLREGKADCVPDVPPDFRVDL